MRCLNALEIPEQGTLSFERPPALHIDFSKKLDKKDILALRRKSGMVFQQYNLFPHKTALENVMEAPVQVQGKPKEQAHAEAVRLLEKVGLADKANLYPHQLSGGQQQRVAIGRALVSDAPVILADEPTGNLDEDTASDIIDILKTAAHDKGKCVIVVTHSKQVAKAADVVLRLRNRKLVA